MQINAFSTFRPKFLMPWLVLGWIGLVLSVAVPFLLMSGPPFLKVEIALNYVYEGLFVCAVLFVLDFLQLRGRSTHYAEYLAALYPPVLADYSSNPDLDPDTKREIVRFLEKKYPELLAKP